MKKAISMILAAAFVLSSALLVSASVQTVFYGYQWLKYDYQAVGGSYGNVTPKSNNTFSIPRTYLRWKMTDDDNGLEGNITLDMNNVNGGQTSSIDWASWIKKGSIDFKKVPLLGDIDAVIRVGQQDVYFGSIDTWQYPVVEKALEDKNSIVSSADQGIAIVGKIPAGFGGYELAVYNGSGYKTTAFDASQNITDKAYDASLLITPIAGLYVRGSHFMKLTNGFGSPAANYTASAVVVGGATGPIQAFCEYVVLSAAKNAVAGSKSGISEGISGFLSIQLLDFLSLNLRADTYNKDTKAVRDEANTYIAGLGFKFSGATSLQINYQLDQNKFPGTGGSDNNVSNNNQWLAQVQWGW